MKNKVAVGNVGAEELAELKTRVITRESIRSTIEALFDNFVKAKARDKKAMAALFNSFASSQDMNPNLEKTANIDAFLQAGGHLTEAQRRFPELLKVAQINNRPAPALSKRPAVGAPTGAGAVRSNVSGGSA